MTKEEVLQISLDRQSELQQAIDQETSRIDTLVEQRAAAENAETDRDLDQSIRDARRTLREFQRSLEIEQNYYSQTERGLTTRTPE